MYNISIKYLLQDLTMWYTDNRNDNVIIMLHHILRTGNVLL